ncbi:MAG: hypothetical protein WC728_11305 [Elusimicrobiota bacterium]
MRTLIFCLFMGVSFSQEELDPHEKANIYRSIFSPKFKVALTQESIDTPEVREMISKAVMTWIEPLRERSPVPLAKEVEFVKEGPGVRGPRDNDEDGGPDQTHAHITVDIGPHSSNSAGISGVEIGVRGGEPGSSDPIRYSDIVHEIGHLFGLDDQYGLGMDYPESVMNAGDISELTEHDLREVTRNFDETLKEMGEQEAAGPGHNLW